MDDRDQRVPIVRRGRARVSGQLAIEARDKLFDLPVHLGHLLSHIENNFDARQVHAEIAREMQNHLQPLEIAVRI